MKLANVQHRYKHLTPKTRLISLSPAFVAYLRADGIVLPAEEHSSPWSTDFQDGEGDDIEAAEEDEDPLKDWPEIHALIKSTISELDGKVYPKLNWSAPKDATWIAATNSMECSTPNDIYLLFKSSDFITHDLEQAFLGCDDELTEAPKEEKVPYTLALRKAVPAMINSMEFRCFVRRRRLIAVCQRDLNHYAFMESLVPILQELIYDFYEEKLKESFPDDSFVFDVYIPKPVEGGRVWLIDINAWAQRTDPLLFSWLEILTMPDLPAEEGEVELDEGFVRLSLRDGVVDGLANGHTDGDSNAESNAAHMDDDIEELPWLPEIRLVGRYDPEAYSFNTPLFSAHKLPKDVVDAGMTGEGGIRDFLNRWDRRQKDPDYDSDNDSS